MTTTFRVANVKPGSVLGARYITAQELGQHPLLGGFIPDGMATNEPADFGLEATSAHPFVQAAYDSFQDHYPLTLAPDDVWLVILQGLAHHIEANAEALRHKFVAHSGQKVLTVEVPYTKGDPNLPWPDIIGKFSNLIADHIGQETRNLLVSAFTTTGVIEQTTSEVVLMGAMKKYFKYDMMTLCGIPTITLLGTTTDWTSVRQRAQNLAQYDLQWWVDVLDPILAEFENASRGSVNSSFWNSLVQISNMSGGPYVSGWICDLFPYREGYDRETSQKRMMRASVGAANNRTTLSSFPPGMTQVPVLWRYLGTEIQMEFRGGFIATAQNKEDGDVRPVQGWMVVDTTRKAPVKPGYGHLR